MSMTMDRTRDVVEGYGRGQHVGDFAAYIGDDIVFKLMNTGEEIRGRAAVEQRVAPDLRLVRELALRNLIVGQGQAVAEVDWVSRDGTVTPHVAVFDVAGDKISALRLYYAGNVPG